MAVLDQHRAEWSQGLTLKIECPAELAFADQLRGDQPFPQSLRRFIGRQKLLGMLGHGFDGVHFQAI